MPQEFRADVRCVRRFAFVAVAASAFFSFASAFPDSADASASRTAYVISALDGRLARVDLDGGGAVLNLATTGSSPNRIVTTADDAFAFVVCSGSSTLDVFELATETRIGTIVLPAGSNPWDAEAVNGLVYVTAVLGDRVDVVDPWGGGVVDVIPVGVAPQGMCVAAGKLYIANTAFDFGTFSYGPGTVSVVDLATRNVVATIGVPTNPQECVATPNGEVHVVCTGDFFATTGSIAIVDPVADTIVDSIPIPAFPGAAAAHTNGEVTLGVTTTSFASEIWRYDAATRTLLHDGTDPLFATGDFLGNPKIARDGSLVVPNFAQDLLLIDDPAPGLLEAYLVGDGPVDAALVELEGTVSLALSGLRATNTDEGVRLDWNTAPEAGLAACVVERAPAGRTFVRVADDLAPMRVMQWVDRAPLEGRAATYRVGGVDARGRITWLPAVTITHAGRAVGDVALTVRAWPNPFRSSTSIRAEFAGGSTHDGAGETADGANVYGERAEFVVFNVAGRAVASGEAAAGTGEWVWDGRDRRGLALAPGAYYVRAAAGGKQATTRLLRLR